MSGGSWNYVYRQIRDAADRLVDGNSSPERVAFGRHLLLVAKAMHDIEWVDSCDMGGGDEFPAISAVVQRADLLAAATDEARRAVENLQRLLAKAEEEP